MMAEKRKLVPIYTSRGDVGALLGYPYLFDLQGEWIGWVSPDRKVYTIQGKYVGWMTGEPRILRKRSYAEEEPDQQPPHIPEPVRVPALYPLPPQMAEITFSEVDVLEEDPQLLPPLDLGEHTSSWE